jgi:hypothetical protein
MAYARNVSLLGLLRGIVEKIAKQRFPSPSLHRPLSIALSRNETLKLLLLLARQAPGRLSVSGEVNDRQFLVHPPLPMVRPQVSLAHRLQLRPRPRG